MHDFLYGFLTWFKAFFDNMLGGVLMVVKGIVLGIIKIFNLPYYFKIWADEAPNFGVFDWIFSILAFLLVLAVWAGVIFLAVLAVRKYIRFRRGIVGNEDLLEEIADLHRDVLRLTSEKERIMQLKVSQAGLSYDQFKELMESTSRIRSSPRPTCPPPRPLALPAWPPWTRSISTTRPRSMSGA